MNTSISLSDEFELIDSHEDSSRFPEGESRVSYEASEPRYELGLWLQALRSYFDPNNHPFQDTEQFGVLTRDWSDELVIVRQTLLRVSQLSLRMVHFERSTSAKPNETVVSELKDGPFDAKLKAGIVQAGSPLVDLAEVMADVAAVCEAILTAPTVGFYSWSAVGKILTRELDRSETARILEKAAYQNAATEVPGNMCNQAGKLSLADDDGATVIAIVSYLARLLHRLRFIDGCLQRDQPLKQTLPVFCLIYSEARALLEFNDSRVLSTGQVESPIFDIVDGINYATAMELRKVFARELIGIASLRHSPTIYARVENAHGLLRDCFQQSFVGVAQLVDSTLDVALLFDTFQTRLEQSLTLRKDLWTLLQLVKRVEQEREQYPMSPLLERLKSFREGSLRYLMYKDWEACERFIEEVAAARGAVEVTPVVHRFSAYLETLLGQVNMRNVLLNHEFEYEATES